MCRSRLAGERGGSETKMSTDPPHSRASALLQWLSATQAIFSAHKICRSRLAGERGGPETKMSTDPPHSWASALLQWLSATQAIVGSHTTRRAGLLASVAGLKRRCRLTHRIRGQARSYSGSQQPRQSSAHTHAIRRSWLAGERGGSATKMSTETPHSRASTLLQCLSATQAIVAAHKIF